MKKVIRFLALFLIVSLMIPAVPASAAGKTLKLTASKAKNGVLTVPKGNYKKVTLSADTAGMTVNIKNATIKTLTVSGSADQPTTFKLKKSKITKVTAKTGFAISGSGSSVETISALTGESTITIGMPVTTITTDKAASNLYLNVNAKIGEINVNGSSVYLNITKDTDTVNVSGEGSMVVGNANVSKFVIAAPNVSVYGVTSDGLSADATANDAIYNGLKIETGKSYTKSELKAIKRVPINLEGRYEFTKNATSHDDIRALLNDENVDVVVWNNAFSNPKKSDFEIIIPENKTVIIKKGIIPQADVTKKNESSLRFKTSNESALIIEDTNGFEKNVTSDVWFAGEKSYIGLDGVVQFENSYVENNDVGFSTLLFMSDNYKNRMMGYIYSGKMLSLQWDSTITVEDELKLRSLGYDTLDRRWLLENLKLGQWGIFDHYDIPDLPY